MIEATGNCMAVSHVLSSFVKRVVISNPLQVNEAARGPVPRTRLRGTVPAPANPARAVITV